MAIETLGILVGVLLISYAARFVPATQSRQCLLLAASYFVYAHWAGKLALLVLIGSSLLNYCWGAVLRRRPTAALLWIGIGLNVLLLGFFKYLLPVAEHLPPLSSQAELLQQITIPIGISFWTFQGLSYLFDLYREEELNPTLLEFCLYMALWPTVLSGPVCRLPKMLPQFRNRPDGSISEDFSIGTVRIIQGLFMKLVLAQLLAAGLTPDGGVNAGFDGVAPPRSGLDVWALAIGYGFQIFFDFAGYSNIVIGAARLLGIRLQENFDRPYLSLTPSIFWTRWHMSLSFWIRDYVFLPLASVRRDPWWPYAAMIISMTIFGFWHGASLTYIAWGIYHGLLLLGHRLCQRANKRLQLKLPHPVGALLSWANTFLLVSLGYIFFRANDLGQAFRMLRAVIEPRSYSFDYATLSHDYYLLVAVMVVGYFLYVGLAQLLVLWTTRYREKLRATAPPAPALRVATWNMFSCAALCTERTVLENKWWWLTPVFVLLLMVTTLSVFGQSSNIAPFIYTLF
jgi:alginate O-acetyltransferase complex protein AlgI